ncbi:MAG TPA: hypothetical protein VN626_01165 [Clostridia bacterium]|nr:hypothetical protein [Clostridia bacterium]
MSSSSVATITQKNTKYYVWSLLSIGLMFFFGAIVPPFAGITPVGISILGIFFGVLISTIATNETFWPAVLGLFAMVVCDYMSAGNLLQAWFGNAVIQQIIWVMALTGAVTESGAVHVLGRKALGIKALQGHPMRLIITLFMTVLACAALVSSPTTMLLLWYPILDSICEMCNIEKNSDLKRELLLGIYLAAMGAYILPFKGVHLSSIAIISGIMEASGLHFDNIAYLVTATLSVVVFVLVYALFIKFVWKTDLTPLKEFTVSKMSMSEADTKLSMKQKVLLGFMISGIVYLLVGMLLPKGSGLYIMYNKIGSTWVWIVLFAILCFMRDKAGKPYIDGVKLLQTRTMWGIVAVAGCFTICGAAIASDDLGIKAAISAFLSPVLNNASWPILVILCVAISTIFTNFTNGMPVSFTINAICIPLACTLQINNEGNASILGVATILSGLCAFLTNGAIAYAPIMLGREEMTNKFIFTKGVVTNVIFIVVTSFLCIVFGYLF